MSAEWTAVSCRVADVIRGSEHITVSAGRSDLGGTYGEPEVYTEWALKLDEQPILREWRFPGYDGEPDRKPCRHEAATGPTS